MFLLLQTFPPKRLPNLEASFYTSLSRTSTLPDSRPDIRQYTLSTLRFSTPSSDQVVRTPWQSLEALLEGGECLGVSIVLVQK